MSEEKEDVIAEACARFQEELESCEEDLEFTQIWTDALEELSEIEKAFGTNELCGKTILDIGTYGIKPLYIALKYKPKKIIGINDGFPDSDAAKIEQKSKLFLETEIKFYECSFFNDVKLKEILNKEILNKKNPKFDFVLVSKTLHHLRSGACFAERRDPGHCCKEDEKCCIYKFDEQEIFERLLCLGKRLIVYEWFDSGAEDNDKVRGRGRYFTTNEWKQIFGFLEKSEKYRVKLIQPSRLHLDKEGLREMDTILRQVDTLCFYVDLVEEEK